MSNQSFNHQNKQKGRGNRNSSRFVEKNQELNSSYDHGIVGFNKQQKNNEKSDTSFNHEDSDDQKKQNTNKFIQKISEKGEKQEDSGQNQQLQPDRPPDVNKLNQSQWSYDQKDDKKEKKSQHKQTQKKTRGNRSQEKQLKTTKKSQYSGSSNKVEKQSSKPIINSDHQLPQQSQVPKRRGNRNSEQQNKNFNRNNNNNYRGGSNYNDRDRNYNNDRDGSYNNRGGRGGYKGGYNNNRNFNDRNNNRDYNDVNRQNRTNSKFETQKESIEQSTYKNPDFQKKRNFYDTDRKEPYNNDRNRNFSQRQGNRPYYNQQYGGNKRNQISAPPSEKIIQKIIQKKEIVQVTKEVMVQVPRPIGRRVHPSVSIFIKGCRLTLTCRRLQQFAADLLVIPYKTTKLELYPGALINSCEINYKQKIKNKGQELQKQGSVYIQKVIGLDKIQTFAFMKIGDPQNSIKTGTKQLLEKLKSIKLTHQKDTSVSPASLKKQKQEKKNVKFQTIIFPISKDLGSSKTVIRAFVDEIEKYTSFVKDIYISTEEYKTFCQAVTKFNQIFQELFQQNQISIS